MFKKKNRGGKALQSGRKVGLEVGGARNVKRSQDLRSALSRKKAKKAQGFRVPATKTNTRNIVDARQTISSKKKLTQPTIRSISLLQDQRKEKRQNEFQKNRSLTLSTGGHIQITTKQDVPPNRSATVMGDSIRITAKVERSKGDLEREANITAGYLTITAKNEEAKRKEREQVLRKRERQNEAKRRERERKAQRREKERRENTLYSQINVENSVYASKKSEPLLAGRFGDSLLEGRLDHGMSSTAAQIQRGPEPSKQDIPTSGCRITVSNLHPLVTQQDVEELFGVVGELRSCKMLGRGSAEVVYVNKEDAHFAISRYNNRKLDGQPMLCKLNMQPSASLYSPPPARLAPLPPLRAAPAPAAKPLPRSVPAEYDGAPTEASRPVVFKVRI